MVVTTRDSTYTAPRTWTTGELVTKTIMDTHIRDNFGAVSDPAYGMSTVDEASNYTTTGTSFANVDATDLYLSFTTSGSDTVLAVFTCVLSFSGTGGNYIHIDLAVDGTAISGNDGLCAYGSSTAGTVSFQRLCTGLSAAAHNFAIQWKVTSGTGTMYAGAGTANLDMHPFFAVIDQA